MTGSTLDLVKYLREKRPIIALVGATNQSQKFGNIILRDMVRKGYKILPINPRATAVDGHAAYHSLSDAAKDHTIGLVVYVIPPPHTLESLAEAKALGLTHVWVQPGAGNEQVREYLDREGFDYLFDACVMVESL